MSLSVLPLPFTPIQAYQPITFSERGVAVPFTTPLLAGTRARLALNQGIELVVPNPSGARGVYVMPWSGIASLCRTTLHDRALSDRIAALPAITPGSIRHVARTVAAEGLAGEAAMEAAVAAEAAYRNDVTVMNYRLLMALIEQVNLLAAGTAEALTNADQERQAEIAAARVAAHLGRPVHWVATALESISGVLEDFGVGPGGMEGRMPRLAAMIRKAAAEIMDWGGYRKEEDQTAYARMVCQAASSALMMADPVMREAQALTCDMVALLRQWSTDPDSIAGIAGRPEWLLDGWEQICLIWSVAGAGAARRAALAEIAGLLPVFPREVRDWCDISLVSGDMHRPRRIIGLNEGWRTGSAAYDAISRNERLRALRC